MKQGSWWWFEDNILPPQEYNSYPKHIKYGVNSHNYRCPEFDTIDWANSHVLLGGSDAYGEGLEDDKILSYYLQEMLNEPVINLAIPAASNQLIVLAMSMLARHHTPKTWIVAWSDSCRWLHWDPKAKNEYDVQAHRGPHAHYCGSPFPQLLDSLDWYSSQARVMAQAIAGDKLIEIGAASIPILEEWGVEGIPYVDQGSANEHHAGSVTHMMAARCVYNQIQNRK